MILNFRDQVNIYQILSYINLSCLKYQEMISQRKSNFFLNESRNFLQNFYISYFLFNKLPLKFISDKDFLFIILSHLRNYQIFINSKKYFEKNGQSLIALYKIISRLGPKTYQKGSIFH